LKWLRVPARSGCEGLAWSNWVKKELPRSDMKGKGGEKDQRQEKQNGAQYMKSEFKKEALLQQTVIAQQAKHQD